MRISFIITTVALDLLPVAGHVFGAAGALDPTFGNGGAVQPNVGSGNTFSFSDAAIGLDGGIVVSGTVNNPGVGISAAIVRYLPTGVQDPSFGTNGVVILPPPPSIFLGTSLTMAVAVQPNGEILTVFFAFNNTSTMSENLLIRLNTNGTVDTTFGSGGAVSLDFPVPVGFGASATIVLAQPDGKILLTGNLAPPFRSKSAPITLLARYPANFIRNRRLSGGGYCDRPIVDDRVIGGRLDPGSQLRGKCRAVHLQRRPACRPNRWKHRRNQGRRHLKRPCHFA